MEQKKAKKYIILAIIFSVLICGGIVLLICSKLFSDKTLTDVKNIFSLSDINPSVIKYEENAEDISKQEKNINPFIWYDKDMQEQLEMYQEYNEDVFAWIKIPDTTIDLPVMQTPNDEGYYLRRDLDKKYNSYGLPFLAADCNLSDIHDNNIIYGHNITKYERAIFADVASYEDVDFYKEHPYIEITTDENTEMYFIFAYLLTDNHDSNPFKYAEVTKFDCVGAFSNYMEEVKKRNWLDTGYKPDYDKKTITLSSCSNELFGTGGNRMLLIAQSMDKSIDYDGLIKNAEKEKTPLLPERLQ